MLDAQDFKIRALLTYERLDDVATRRSHRELMFTEAVEATQNVFLIDRKH